MGSIGKTTIQIYRDCLRLAHFVGGGSNSPKGRSIKENIRSSFKKNKGATNPAEIEVMRGHAIRALANYLMLNQGIRDERMKKSLDNFSNKEADSVKEPK